MKTKISALTGVMLVALVGFGGKAMAEDTAVQVQRLAGMDGRGIERMLMQDCG